MVQYMVQNANVLLSYFAYALILIKPFVMREKIQKNKGVAGAVPTKSIIYQMLNNAKEY